jgi:Uma2 family endonuclease
MLTDMRAVFAAVPQWIQDQRRSTGEDRHDEVWDGVLHVPPFPTSLHQDLQAQLMFALRPLAEGRGWKIFGEIAVYDPAKGERNYRVPDVNVVDPAFLSRRGVEGRVELAIEILSPDDESREKFQFFARHGTQELWLVEPETRAFEVYVLRGGTYFASAPDAQGLVRAPMFDLTLQTVDGKLVISGRELRVEI